MPPYPLDTQPTIADTASYLWHAIAFARAEVKEAVAWVDGLLMVTPEPPIHLIELALCADRHPGDALHWLRLFDPAPDPGLVFAMVMARTGAHYDIDQDPDAAARVIFRFISVPPPLPVAKDDLRAAYDFDYQWSMSDPAHSDSEARRRAVAWYLDRFRPYRRLLPQSG